MSAIQLNHASGGSVTIAPASTATAKTLTAPAVNGNIITSADSGTVTGTMLASATVAQSNLATNVAGNGPAFYAYTTSATTITSATVKVTFNAKTSPGFDTASAFDATTNYRFQPTVAGYYYILGATSTASNPCQVYIYKNGSMYLTGSYSGATATTLSVVSGIVYLNGSSDYVELWAYCAVSTANNTSTGVTYLQGFLARSA